MINESSEDVSRLNKRFKKKSGYSFDIIDMSDRKALDYIKKEWINKGRGIKGAIAVCKEDDVLAGYIYVKEKPTGNNIGPFMVYKEYRGYGASELLLKKAINDYKGNRLGVYADNEIALRLYKKFGFVVVEESKDDEGNKYYIMELKSSTVKENYMEILDESYFDEGFLSDLYNKANAKAVEDQVNRLIYNGKYKEALDYLEKNKKYLSEDKYNELKNKINGSNNSSSNNNNNNSTFTKKDYDWAVNRIKSFELCKDEPAELDEAGLWYEKVPYSNYKNYFNKNKSEFTQVGSKGDGMIDRFEEYNCNKAIELFNQYPAYSTNHLGSGYWLIYFPTLDKFMDSDDGDVSDFGKSDLLSYNQLIKLCSSNYITNSKNLLAAIKQADKDLGLNRLK